MLEKLGFHSRVQSRMLLTLMAGGVIWFSQIFLFW